MLCLSVSISSRLLPIKISPQPPIITTYRNPPTTIQTVHHLSPSKQLLSIYRPFFFSICRNSFRRRRPCPRTKSFPQEILTNHLSRLPVKSLYQFKSVSPSWNSLISWFEFVKTHLNRTKKTNYAGQKIIIITSSSTSYNLHSIDFAGVNPTIVTVDLPNNSSEIKVLSSCEGLLLVNRYDFSNFLLNPSTRECKELPPFPFALPRDRLYYRAAACFVWYKR